MISRAALLFSLLMSCPVVYAEDWVKVGENDRFLWQARTGSGSLSKNRGGKPLVIATGRVYDKTDKTYVFEKWYVTLEHCESGGGKLVTLTIDSDFKYDNDFLLKGGTVGSSIAETLCDVATSFKQERSEKGI